MSPLKSRAFFAELAVEAMADEYPKKVLDAVSRVLSKVLRHEPELLRIRLDASGWVDVDELLTRLNQARGSPGAPKRIRSLPPMTYALLHDVVSTSDKSRFALSADGARIRAVQGHSVPVDLHYPAVTPPELLFHGTAAGNWASISKRGLERKARHAVHLSSDVDTARRVGARHGRPVVLEVRAGAMHRDGHQFSCADNGVWLVLDVPARYIRLLLD